MLPSYARDLVLWDAPIEWFQRGLCKERTWLRGLRDVDVDAWVFPTRRALCGFELTSSFAYELRFSTPEKSSGGSPRI